MTLEEMALDLHETLGELSDLEFRDPITGVPDVTTKGWRDITRILNEAQLKIAFHKNSGGRLVRMRLTETIGRLMVQRIAATVVSFTGNTLTLLSAGHPADYYRGMLVVGTGTGRGVIFVHYLGAPDDTVIMSNVTGTFTAGEAITIVRREYLFGDSSVTNPIVAGSIWFPYAQGRPVEITGIVDEEGNELDLAEKPDEYTQVSTTEGTPASYTKISGGIRFDTFPDTADTYLVRAMRSPVPMVTTLVTATPEIPEVFHRCMVLYAQWWFLVRGQELQAAYGVRRTYEEMIRDAQTEFDLQDRVQRGQIKFYTEGR